MNARLLFPRALQILQHLRPVNTVNLPRVGRAADWPASAGQLSDDGLYVTNACSLRVRIRHRLFFSPCRACEHRMPRQQSVVRHVLLEPLILSRLVTSANLKSSQQSSSGSPSTQARPRPCHLYRLHQLFSACPGASY